MCRSPSARRSSASGPSSTSRHVHPPFSSVDSCRTPTGRAPRASRWSGALTRESPTASSRMPRAWRSLPRPASRPGSSQRSTRRRREASTRPSRPRSPAGRSPISIGGSRHARSGRRLVGADRPRPRHGPWRGGPRRGCSSYGASRGSVDEVAWDPAAGTIDDGRARGRRRDREPRRREHRAAMGPPREAASHSRGSRVDGTRLLGERPSSQPRIPAGAAPRLGGGLLCRAARRRGGEREMQAVTCCQHHPGREAAADPPPPGCRVRESTSGGGPRAREGRRRAEGQPCPCNSGGSGQSLEAGPPVVELGRPRRCRRGRTSTRWRLSGSRASSQPRSPGCGAEPQLRRLRSDTSCTGRRSSRCRGVAVKARVRRDGRGDAARRPARATGAADRAGVAARPPPTFTARWSTSGVVGQPAP